MKTCIAFLIALLCASPAAATRTITDSKTTAIGDRVSLDITMDPWLFNENETGLRSAQAPPSRRQEFTLPQTKAAGLPLSDAVLVGDTLYIAGRGGVDLATRTVPANVRDEIKLMMDDYKAILALAGMTMDDLVSVTVYCPDLKLYAEFNDIYRTYFSKSLPARAFIGSGPLLFGMRFEMVGVAVKR